MAEEPADLSAFCKASKSMLDVGADPVLKVQWLMKHPSPETLRVCSEMGRGDLVIEMLKSGVSPTAWTGNAMMLAIQNGLHEVIEWLWTAGPQHIKDQVCNDVRAAAACLSYASECGFDRTVQLLLTPSTPLTPDCVYCRSCYEALQQACYKGRESVVRVLLAHGASCTQGLLEDGMSALHYVCAGRGKENARVNIVRMLLSSPQGMSVIDAFHDGGCSALHLAAWKGHASICDLLLTSDPNSQSSIHALTDDRYTPYQMAWQHPHVQDVLLRHGARPSKKKFVLDVDRCDDSPHTSDDD